ncbi:MAG: HEAT repeat domain-containing protein [Chloroflexota bacterium]
MKHPASPSECIQRLEVMLRAGSNAVKLSRDQIDYMNQCPTSSVTILLKQLLGSEDLFLESRAFDGLMNLSGFDHVGFLCSELTTSGHKDWKAVYCERLASFQDPRVIPALCQILEYDEDPDVRFVAAEQLGEIGDVTVIRPLERAASLDHGEDFEGRLVSDAAQEAIRAIRSRVERNQRNG